MTLNKQLNDSFTTIADTTDFATFEFSPTGVPIPTAPAINNRGEVAFWGAETPLDAGIFVGNGHSLTTIAETSGKFSFLGVGPSINDRGTVAFLGGLDSGDAGYFTGNGTTTTRIVDSSGQFNFRRIPTLDNLFGEPVINDRGTVAFRADLDNGDKEIFSSKKGQIQTITNVPELTTFGITPDINTKGTIVFSAGTAPVPGSIEVNGQTVPIAELFQNAGIFTSHGGNLNTGASLLPEAIADPTDGFTLFGSSPAINDQGTVAFVAVNTNGEAEVLIGKGKGLTTVADSRGVFSSFRGVDINNQGTVAYLADFDAGGSGLFVGQQEIIATGDELSNSTVTELNFLNKGLNQDSVAFWAKLADGRSGVFRADVNKASKSPFDLNHLYNDIGRYTTTIAADGDSADVYFPKLPKSDCNSIEFPIALLLQGALVDKSDYSNFASQVASYGFVVVVPNHERTLTGPNGQSTTGLFPEEGQVNDVLAEMKHEDQDAASPIFKIVDTTKLGLLGHSFGGAVGLAASQQDVQVPGFSSQGYTRPAELKAGIFYGANLRNQQTNEALPINNDGIALGLIQGDLDGVAAPINAQNTYDQIRNPPKALITVKGTNHYGITNEDNPARDPNRPTLDQAAATRAIAKSSGLFLRANILNDRRAFDSIFNAATPFDPNVSIVSQAKTLR